MEKATAETLYNELKTRGTLKEEVLTALKHVWTEQVNIIECLKQDQIVDNHFLYIWFLFQEKLVLR